MQTGILVSLSLYFVLMLAIGVYAWRKSTSDSEGYLLAGRNLSPSVTALSAGASDMSGWLLLGLPGALYASGLGVMTAAAWTSSFPRYRVGLGAVMFAVSDLLIFADLGPLADSALPGLLIWPLYYFGQFLICTGVVGELKRRDG